MEKFAAWSVFAVLVCGPTVADEPSDRMTREEALKFCRTLDGKESGDFWFEHGDKVGPYHHAGRIILTPGQRAAYAVADPGGDLSVTGLDVPDDAAALHMDFFTGTSGQGWVTTHWFRPEVEPEEKPRQQDKRSNLQKALGPAAELAIEEGDLVFLKTLVDRGLELNEYLDFEEKTTALSQAVWAGNKEIAAWLLERGADKDMRARFGERPIATAHDLKKDDLCKLLARPDDVEKHIAGVPSGLLEEIFARLDPDGMFFVRWQGDDPPDDLMEWLKPIFPNARPASRMEILERRPLGARTWYRDTKDGKFGSLVEVSAGPIDEGWQVRVRQSVGPSLAGGGHVTRYTRHHGYWMGELVSSWAE